MQKLVKRRMHYETIMPVEAYECEDDPLMEEAEFWGMGLFIVSAGIVGTALGGPLGGIAASQAVRAADHYFDLWDTMAEGEVERQRIEQENHDAMHNLISNTVDAIIEGANDVASDFLDELGVDEDSKPVFPASSG